MSVSSTRMLSTHTWGINAAPPTNSGSEQDEYDGKDDVGAGIVVAVRNRDLGRRSEVQILTGNVVSTRANIPVVDILLRRRQLPTPGWRSLLGQVDAEKECRCKPRECGKHDPGRCLVKPVLYQSVLRAKANNRRSIPMAATPTGIQPNHIALVSIPW
jgi:hypothetical protein